MDSPKGTNKKGLLLKTWNRCKSFSNTVGMRAGSSLKSNRAMRSQSWPRGTLTNTEPHDQVTKKKQPTRGCFSIYVGKEKERFVIKTKYVNHPLFRMLLADAEYEYGFNSEGPLLLPCEADYFLDVLTEIGYGDKEIISRHGRRGCDSIIRSQSFPAEIL